MKKAKKVTLLTLLPMVVTTPIAISILNSKENSIICNIENKTISNRATVDDLKEYELSELTNLSQNALEVTEEELNGALRNTATLDSLRFTIGGYIGTQIDNYPRDHDVDGYLDFDYLTAKIDNVENVDGVFESFVVATLSMHELNSSSPKTLCQVKFTGFAPIKTELQNKNKTFNIGVYNKPASDFDEETIKPIIKKNIDSILRNVPNEKYLGAPLTITVTKYTPSEDDNSATLDVDFNNVYDATFATPQKLTVTGMVITGFNKESNKVNDQGIGQGIVIAESGGTPSYVWIIVGSIIGLIVIILIVLSIYLNKNRDKQINASLKKLTARQSTPALPHNNNKQRLSSPMPTPTGSRPPMNNPRQMTPRTITTPSSVPPRGPVPRSMPGVAQRPGVSRHNAPLPPKIEVSGPSKSLAPKKR